MSKYDQAPETVEVRRARLNQLIGKNVQFSASDVLYSLHGDKAGIPLNNFVRLQPERGEGNLAISGMAEEVVDGFTPQYTREPTEVVPIIMLRHSIIYGPEGSVIKAVANAPRSGIRLDRIVPGTIIDLGEEQSFPSAA